MELQAAMDAVSEEECREMADFIETEWDFVKKPREGTVEQSIRLYMAIRGKIEDRRYDAFSYNDVDGIKKIFGFAPAGAMTLLHEKLNIPTVPENDSMGAVTQLMVQFLTGQIGAYLEFYEFMEDGALMGVPDYVPGEIVDGKVTIMPNSFGDFGEGLLNVSKLKTGEITLARLGYTGDRYVMHMIAADARSPIIWEEAGWAPPVPQLPSLDIFMGDKTGDFIDKVMAQHYIISYGDNTGLLKNLCSILGVTVV
jgi:L-fucose isomerase-like protein